nr:hypothetical protein [Bacteroidota bacterium]
MVFGKHHFIVYFTICFSLVTKMSAQDISTDIWVSKYLQLFHDNGFGWESNSSFKPYQLNDINELLSDDSNQFPIQWMLNDCNSPGFWNIFKPGIDTDKLQCNAWFGTLLQYSDGDGVK